MIESGLIEAIVVADKGFYSASNVSLLQKEQIQFILPLKRDSSKIDYSSLVKNEFKTGDCYFEHEKRVIWHKTFPAENDLHLYLFLDEQLKVREDADYLTRLGKDTLNRKYRFKKRAGFDPDSLRIPKRIFETPSPLGDINEDTIRTAISHYIQAI